MAGLRCAPVRLAEDLLQPGSEALQDGLDVLRVAFRCREAHRSVVAYWCMHPGIRPSVGARKLAVAASSRAAWTLRDRLR